MLGSVGEPRHSRAAMQCQAVLLLGSIGEPSHSTVVMPCCSAAKLTSQWKCKPETGRPSEMMHAMLSTSAICKEGEKK